MPQEQWEQTKAMYEDGPTRPGSAIERAANAHEANSQPQGEAATPHSNSAIELAADRHEAAEAEQLQVQAQDSTTRQSVDKGEQTVAETSSSQETASAESTSSKSAIEAAADRHEAETANDNAADISGEFRSAAVSMGL